MRWFNSKEKKESRNAQTGRFEVSRQELKKKVEEGTARTIKYYGRSLKKLAEFDRA